jgi:hypothetical protein
LFLLLQVLCFQPGEEKEDERNSRSENGWSITMLVTLQGEVFMSEKLSSGTILRFIHPKTKEIEVEDVLEILRTVYQRAASPVVKECLQEACAEIAYLTSSEGTFEEYLSLESQVEDADQSEQSEHERDAV